MLLRFFFVLFYSPCSFWVSLFQFKDITKTCFMEKPSCIPSSHSLPNGVAQFIDGLIPSDDDVSIWSIYCFLTMCCLYSFLTMCHDFHVSVQGKDEGDVRRILQDVNGCMP